MMKSMSGFGHTCLGAPCAPDRGASVGIELRAYNSRYLEVHTRIPDTLADREHEIQELVRKSIKRGKVSVTIRVESGDASKASFHVNREALHSYARQLSELRESLSIDSPPTLDTLLALPGVVEVPSQDDCSAEERWTSVRSALEKAISELDAMRQKEGKKLCSAIDKRIRKLRGLTKRISQRAPIVLQTYQRKLKENVQKLLTGTSVELSKEDLQREIAIFADKCDISEEIDRLRCHLDHFSEIAAGEEEVGKRLDFLSQEMFREANTIAQKACDGVTSRLVVAMKAEIEKIREQLQNIE